MKSHLKSIGIGMVGAVILLYIYNKSGQVRKILGGAA